MAKMLRPNNRVGDYTIVEELRRGPNAVSYKAKHHDGRMAFLKQYSSPTPAVDWYNGYRKYEIEKRARLVNSDALKYCLVPIDIFEAVHGCNTFFQAYDFIEGGEDLKQFLTRIQSAPIADTWQQRLTFARIFLVALRSIAKVGFVHGDLKPENIHLLRDTSIESGYRPRLIDMDASLLTDLEAPWHGKGEGYIGTPSYMSPEHSTKPLPASDVFTASLIIHELICRERPYRDYSGAADVAIMIRRDPAPMPTLLGTLSNPTVDLDLRKALQAALSARAGDRPSIEELRLALLGRPKPPVFPPVAPSRHATLTLVGSAGGERSFNITTRFGRQLGRLLSDAGSILAEDQFILKRTTADQWQIEASVGPHARPVLLNGALIAGPCALKSGDRISVPAPFTGGPEFFVGVRIS